MADISVPYWNIVDVNMLCEGARLIGFDLDNTLARSKKPMKADMAECFSALTSLIDVAVITGGKAPVPTSQILYNQAIIDGIFKSNESGHEVEINIPEI